MSDVMTIGAFWALLSGAVPTEKMGRFIAHLNNPDTFFRPHRIPTLAANSRGYEPGGNYWRGSVWAPTNYMVMKGLEQVGSSKLANEIGLNHLNNVVQVFRETGTLWENYAPEQITSGQLAAPEFVDWTGVSTISVLLEFVLGIKPRGERNEIVWEIRMTDRHGVERYPFGKEGTLTLICEERASLSERPVIRACSNIQKSNC